MRRHSRASGFTLIELMIVVAIIGVLSSLAIPAFKRYVSKTRSAEATIKLTEIYRALTAYYISDRTVAGAALSGSGTTAGGAKCIAVPSGYLHGSPHPHWGTGNRKYTHNWTAAARALGIADREGHHFSYYVTEYSSANAGQCGGLPNGSGMLYRLQAFGNMSGGPPGWGPGLEQHRMWMGVDDNGSPFNGGINVINRGQ